MTLKLVYFIKHVKKSQMNYMKTSFFNAYMTLWWRNTTNFQYEPILIEMFLFAGLLLIFYLLIYFDTILLLVN